MKYAKIAVSEVTFWVDRPYDYSVPASMEDALLPGMRVTVPFGKGNRRAEGVVLSVSDHSDYDAPKSIQAVSASSRTRSALPAKSGRPRVRSAQSG